MASFTITLSDELSQLLEEAARKHGLCPEEFARGAIEKRIASSRDDFDKAARYVLEKNAELYRRLA